MSAARYQMLPIPIQWPSACDRVDRRRGPRARWTLPVRVATRPRSGAGPGTSLGFSSFQSCRVAQGRAIVTVRGPSVPCSRSRMPCRWRSCPARNVSVSRTRRPSSSPVSTRSSLACSGPRLTVSGDSSIGTTCAGSLAQVRSPIRSGRDRRRSTIGFSPRYLQHELLELAALAAHDRPRRAASSTVVTRCGRSGPVGRAGAGQGRGLRRRRGAAPGVGGGRLGLRLSARRLLRRGARVRRGREMSDKR